MKTGQRRDAVALVPILQQNPAMSNSDVSIELSNRPDLARKTSDLAAFLDAQKAVDPFIHIFPDSASITDAFIIATATSRRHAQGLAEGILRVCKEKGHEFLRMEGFDAAQWILVDCNDVIIHIFQDDIRALYRLEDLCLHAPRKEALE